MEKKDIENKANDILKKHSDAVTFFVDIVKLAQMAGFVVGNSNIKDDEDGFILVNEDEKIPGVNSNRVIGVNSNRTFEEKRFIIAHELGHFFAASKQNKKIYAHREHKKGRSDEENEYDFFAACLLMPADLFSATVDKLRKENVKDLISETAKIFQVPFSSAERRFVELNIGVANCE